MTLSMYQASAPVFVQGLSGLAGVLAKAEAFARARKFDQAVLLRTRLYPDMFPLNIQVQQATVHATRCIALLAGQDQPDLGPAETTVAELAARVGKALDLVQAATPQQTTAARTGKSSRRSAPGR